MTLQQPLDEMDSDRSMIILGPNRSYQNRGCEAIVRGTTKILRKYFDDPIFPYLGVYQSHDQFEQQKTKEYDSDIIYLHTPFLHGKYHPMRYIRYGITQTSQSLTGTMLYKDMIPYLAQSKAVLAVGGDNYSLDYGIPKSDTAYDTFVLSHKKPLYYWGASVGPFSGNPKYEIFMKQHLQSITRIFSRESMTTDYLASIGIKENVIDVADPAFAMDAVKPSDADELGIENNAVGLNFSPLMAKYVTSGNLNEWKNIVAKILKKIQENIDCPLYLVPHVMSQDYTFMHDVLRMLPNNDSINLISQKYNAEELKWIIGQMKCFAGARTHSTIAALSTYVPTLSLAYSIKANGINRDIFGNLQYCITPMTRDYANVVSDMFIRMYDTRAIINSSLKERMPKILHRAYLAGEILAERCA